MAPSPDWKRYLEVGMQFTEMRRSQARRIAADLAEQGQLAADQVTGAVDELVAMSRRRTDELRDVVRSEVERQLGSLGLATKADLTRLERKLSASKASKPASAKRPATKPAKQSSASRAAPKKAKASARARKAPAKAKTPAKAAKAGAAKASAKKAG